VADLTARSEDYEIEGSVTNYAIRELATVGSWGEVNELLENSLGRRSDVF
jgi:hypothetical protein